MERILQFDNNGYSSVGISRLADPSVLNQLLHRFSDLYPGANRAAIVSQWSMNYLCVVMPATIVPALALDMAVDLGADGVELLHEDAKPFALKATGKLQPLSSAQRSWLWEQLVYGHLEPVLKQLAQVGGVAPKVLWNNLVVVWDELFKRLSPSLPDRQGLEEFHLWLEQCRACNGKLRLRNLQRMVASPAPELHPQLPLRAHCCLHYQLHDPVEGEFPVWCESCPKLHRRPQEEQVSYLYQLHLECQQD